MHNGLYWYTRMPFRLKNASATLWEAMDIIQVPVKWQDVLTYIDDIVILSSSPERHLRQVEYVLQLMKKTEMTLKLKKCSFFFDAVNYLGHAITPRRLHIGTKTIDAVLNLIYLTTMSELRSFLRLCNVYCRFVSSFARVAGPLNRPLRKGEPTRIKLNDDKRRKVDNLEWKLTSPPVLALPRLEGQCMVETDAWDEQVGCVLLHKQESGEIRPVVYWSRMLNDAEKNYDTTHTDC